VELGRKAALRALDLPTEDDAAAAARSAYAEVSR
jgi:hypothetical protein